MEPEGIRKVLAEQGTEGAIYYLAHVIQGLEAKIDSLVVSSPAEEPKAQEEEGK